jgi:hypothetical protein
MAFAIGCGGGDLVLPPGTGPAQVVMVDGDQQEAVTGAQVEDSLVVRVVDTAGLGVVGQEVAWTVSLGGGQVQPPTSTTDADGLAWTRWTLGPNVGANAVRATVAGGGFVTFSAIGTEPPVTADPVRIERVEGNDQSAAAGSLVAVPPAVKVTDAGGRPVAGVAVSFMVTAGGGTVEGGEATTGSNGVARVAAWRLGPTPGPNTVEARAGSLEGSPVVFTAEGTTGAGVDHFVFRLQPHDVDTGEPFGVEVAMVDAVGNVVDLSGILIYIGLFREGSDIPVNKRMTGSRFQDTEHGVAVFDGLAISVPGRYRLRALSDQLPQLGPHGPEPFLFSLDFDVQ